MKNVLAKLNGPALKKLGIEHGEKIGLGIVVLTCLLILGLGRWRGYEKTPMELNSLASTTEASIKNSEWPKKHRVDYAPVDYIKKSEELLAALDVSPFDYKTPISHPVYRPLEPIKEPQWETVLDLRADYGKGILALLPAGSAPSSATLTDASSTEGTATTATTTPGSADGELEFNRRPPANNPNATTAGPIGSDGGAGKGQGHGEGKAKGKFAPGSAGGEGGAYGAMASASPVGEGRGIRFVSVRGVFPYEKQLDKLANALRLDFKDQAIDYLEFADFEIQRQRAQSGPDPWKDAKWETLNIQSAMDVLNECEGFAPDVLDADYTSQVITMPLPSLVEMEWSGRFANHPLLSKYQLSVKEMEEALIANEKILSMQQQEEEKKRMGTGGFAAIQKDMRTIRRSVLNPSGGMGGVGMGGGMSAGEGAMPGMRGAKAPMPSMRPGMRGGHDGGGAMPGMERMPSTGGHGQSNYAKIMGELQGGTGGEPNQSIGQRLQLQLVPRYLLFRYLDFDVEPGEAYRYRVRLKIYNPNFGRAPEEVEKPSIVEGEMRETEWSQPSPPAVIDTDVHFFLTQVFKKATRAKNEVEWNIFQWAQKEGTYLHEKLKVTLGQFIGGKAETMVLNPAAPSFKKQKDREFRAPDLLVDSYASPGTGLVPAEHPDLNFNVKASAKTASLNVPDQAVVVNRFGELVPFDTVSTKPSESTIEAKVNRERKAFEHLLNQEEGEASSAGGLEGYIRMQEGGSAGGEAKAKKKKKNPLENRGPGGGMASMMGAGSGHGGGDGGDAGGSTKKSKKSKKSGSAQ